MSTDTEFTIRVPRQTKVLSVKIDTYIDSLIENVAKKHGFSSKSELLRFIICAVLAELGELSIDDEYLCYNTRLKHVEKKLDDDPDMLVALANTVAALRGLEPEKTLNQLVAYVDLLEAVV